MRALEKVFMAHSRKHIPTGARIHTAGCPHAGRLGRHQIPKVAVLACAEQRIRLQALVWLDGLGLCLAGADSGQFLLKA